MAFDKAKLAHPNRRIERVELDAGEVWVKELTCAETAQLMERAARPKIDPRGGVDPAASVIWQIILSCYEGEDKDARRVFGDGDEHLLYNLRMEEMARLNAAINRVNGQSETEVQALTSFFGPTPDS